MRAITNPTGERYIRIDYSNPLPRYCVFTAGRNPGRTGFGMYAFFPYTTQGWLDAIAYRDEVLAAQQSRRVALIDNPGSTADTFVIREGGTVRRRRSEQRLVTKMRTDFPSEYYEQHAKIDLLDKTRGRAYEAKSGRSNIGAAAGQVMLYVYKMWKTNQLLLTPWLLLDWEPSDIEFTWLHKQGVGVVYLTDDWYETA